MSTEKKMFKNPVIEALAISGPKTMIPFHFMIISYLVYRGWQSGLTDSVYTAFGIFCAGMLFWTLIEYLLHRYIFHFVKDHKLIKKMHYILHGYHHNVPRDNKRLIMPPLPVSLIILFFGTSFYLLMGQAFWFFLPGFELGYLTYALIHYATHTITANQAPAFMRPLWIHHALHHYKYPDKAFGVSNRFWDRVFGTMPPPQT